MPKFLRMMTSSQDIESQLPNHLLEHLNAEIVLRNVSSVADAVRWLECTYLYQRIPKNHLMYGFNLKKAQVSCLIVVKIDKVLEHRGICVFCSLV